MCRLAAYVGPERSLAELWLAPAHSLVVQSYAPKEMASAILNADGFGVAWYTRADEAPARYRSVLPMWGDENLPQMAPHLVTGHALANVRSATPGFGIQASNVSPFVDGRWSFSHNGYVKDFGRLLQRRLRDGLDDERYRSIAGTTDSEHLFALVRQGLVAHSPREDPTEVLAQALRTVVDWCREAKTEALLNVLLSDGRWLCASRLSVGLPAPSLYRRVRLDGAVDIVSERLDEDPAWSAVSPGTLLTVAPDRTVRESSL